MRSTPPYIVLSALAYTIMFLVHITRPPMQVISLLLIIQGGTR